MPRVRLQVDKSREEELRKFIKIKLVANDMEQQDLAKMMGITPASMTNRLKKGLFSYGELVNILFKLKATDEEILKLMKRR